jgi:hypothetical protein
MRSGGQWNSWHCALTELVPQASQTLFRFWDTVALIDIEPLGSTFAEERRKKFNDSRVLSPQKNHPSSSMISAATACGAISVARKNSFAMHAVNAAKLRLPCTSESNQKECQAVVPGILASMHLMEQKLSLRRAAFEDRVQYYLVQPATNVPSISGRSNQGTGLTGRFHE